MNLQSALKSLDEMTLCPPPNRTVPVNSLRMAVHRHTMSPCLDSNSLKELARSSR